MVELTPESCIKECPDTDVPLDELKRRAATNNTCDRCENPEWRLLSQGMCFSCITGEADNSNDYELVEI